MDQWRGKVAIVTGASAGIGKAIASRLALEGLRVVAVARRAENLNDLAASFSASKGGQLIPYVCDITDDKSVHELIKTVEEKYGGAQILVNNAGTATKTNILDGEVEKWRWMFELNVIAAGLMISETLKSMKRKGLKQGHIINISSISGHGIPYGLGKHIYNGSKHALRLLTEGVRAELTEQKSKIKITMVSPGFVKTEIFEVGGWGACSEDFPVLNSEDIALACVQVLSTPPNMLVADYIVRPIGETSPA